MKGQQSDNIRNVNMTEQFDINMFNKIYEDNKEDSVYDRGYNDWMKKIIIKKCYNNLKCLINHLIKIYLIVKFEKYKLQQQKQMKHKLLNMMNHK